MAAIMVIEGLGRALDPSLNILTYAKSCLLERTKKNIRDRVLQRLYNLSQDWVDSSIFTSFHHLLLNYFF